MIILHRFLLTRLTIPQEMYLWRKYGYRYHAIIATLYRVIPVSCRVVCNTLHV